MSLRLLRGLLLASLLSVQAADAGSRIYSRLPQFIDHSSLIVLGWIRSAQAERKRFADDSVRVVTRMTFEVERVLFNASADVSAGEHIEYLLPGGRLPDSEGDEEVVVIGGISHAGVGTRAVLFIPQQRWGGERGPPLEELYLEEGADGRQYLLQRRSVIEALDPTGYRYATVASADGRRSVGVEEVGALVADADELLLRLQAVIGVIKDEPVGRCFAAPLAGMKYWAASDWSDPQQQIPAGCAYSRDPCGWLTDHTLASVSDPFPYLAARDALVTARGYRDFVDAASRAAGELAGPAEGWLLLGWHEPQAGRDELLYVTYTGARACEARYVMAIAGGARGERYRLTHGRSALLDCEAPAFPVVCESAADYEPAANRLDAHAAGAGTVFFLRDDGDRCGLSLPSGTEPDWLRALQDGAFLESPWQR